MKYVAALVQFVLKSLQLFALLEELWINTKLSFAGWSVEGGAFFSLQVCRLRDFVVDFLKLDNVQCLLSFHPEKRQENPAGVCGLLGSYTPNMLRPVLWTARMIDYLVLHVATKGLIEKRNGLRFTHRNNDGRAECCSAGSSANTEGSFTVNDSGRIREIHGGDFIERGGLLCGFLGNCGFMACKPFLVAAFRRLLDLFCGKLGTGHLISFTDRCFGLMRCGNTTSALRLYSIPVAGFVAVKS